jgi:hypothetical protein
MVSIAPVRELADTYAAVAPKISILRAFVISANAREKQVESKTIKPSCSLWDRTTDRRITEHSGKIEATTAVMRNEILRKVDSLYS